MLMGGEANATVRQYVKDFSGEQVIHCHKVDHEDWGMMLVNKILPPSENGECSCSQYNNVCDDQKSFSALLTEFGIEKYPYESDESESAGNEGTTKSEDDSDDGWGIKPAEVVVYLLLLLCVSV